MRKLILLLLLCILVIPDANAKKYITTENANVREGAGTKYAAIGVLKEGTTVDADDISGKWTRITYDGNEGYIISEFLKDAPESSTPATSEQPADAGMNNDTIIVFVIIGFLIFLAVLKRLYEMRKGISSKNAKANASKDKTPKTMYWYQCEICRAVIRKETDPKAEGCSMAPDHKWNKLAEVGTRKFFCKKCSTAIGTKGEPVANGCIESTEHEWTGF